MKLSTLRQALANIDATLTGDTGVYIRPGTYSEAREVEEAVLIYGESEDDIILYVEIA